MAQGYQCWTASPLLGTADILRRESKDLQRYFGDDKLWTYAERPGRFHAWSWTILDAGERSLFVGAVDEDLFLKVLDIDLINGHIDIWVDVEGYDFDPSASAYRMARLVVPKSRDAGPTPLAKVMSLWIEEVRRCEQVPRAGLQPSFRDKPLLGYTSWYNRYTNIDAAYLNSILTHVSSMTKAKVFQIDDGYQLRVGDWLLPSSGFPDGVRALSQRAAELGMLPGIWCAPFVTMEFADSTRAHPEWLLRDQNGQPVVCGDFSHWGGKFLAWDTEHLGFRAWMDNILKTMIVDWGFRFVKADFLYAAAMLAAGGKTRAERGARAHQWLWQVVRGYGAELLSCGAVMANAYARCDYARIGPDVALEWELTAERRHSSREKCSTRAAIINTATRYGLHGVAFGNDPDVVILRADNQNLSLAQRRALSRTNTALGGLLFASDDPALYGPDERELLVELERGLPPLSLSGLSYQDSERFVLQALQGELCFDLNEDAPKLTFTAS